RRFEEQLFPVLTPLAVDPGHPFPYISNLSLNLAVVVCDERDGSRRFARVKVPPLLSRFQVTEDGTRLYPLEQLIGECLPMLFPGMDVEGWHPFRVTRNADLMVDDEESDDLLAAVEMQLRQRRFGRAVRLEVNAGMPAGIRELLLRELQLTADDLYEIDGLLDPGSLSELYALNRPELKFPPPAPVAPPGLGAPGDLFAVGGRRPRRAGHQADDVPDVARQPHPPGPHPGRRGGQAGRRPRRADGPLQRGGQHRLGPPAGGGRRPRGLRPRRAEDGGQGDAGRAPGAGRAAPLLPHRDGQLRPDHRPAVRRRRPPDRRRGHRRRP